MENFAEIRRYFAQYGDVKPTVIFDGSSSMIRMGHHRIDETNSAGQPNGALHGLLLDLKYKLSGGMPFNNVYVVFDRGGSIRRKRMNKEYKAQRSSVYSVYMSMGEGMVESEARESWYRQQDKAIELLDYIGIKGLFLENVEGDDIISWLASLGPSVIVSPDGDFHQLITSTTTIYDPRKKVFITPDNFQETTAKIYKGIKLVPEQVLLGKAIVGDTSDNLKGVPQLGWKRLGDLMAEGFTTLDALLKHESKYVEKIKKNIEVVESNLKIMDLSQPQISTTGVSTLMAHVRRPCNCDMQKFWNGCAKEGLSSFVFDQSFMQVMMSAKRKFS